MRRTFVARTSFGHPVSVRVHGGSRPRLTVASHYRIVLDAVAVAGLVASLRSGSTIAVETHGRVIALDVDPLDVGPLADALEHLFEDRS